MRDIIQLTETSEDLRSEFFNMTTLKAVKGLFPYSILDKLQDEPRGSTRIEMESIYNYVSNRRDKIKKMLRDVEGPSAIDKSKKYVATLDDNAVDEDNDSNSSEDDGDSDIESLDNEAAERVMHAGVFTDEEDMQSTSSSYSYESEDEMFQGLTSPTSETECDLP